MDAKLFWNYTNGHLEFIDTIQQKQVVKFQYHIGELIFENGEFDKINSCSPVNDIITMYLEYRDFIYEVSGYTDRLYVLHLSQFTFHAGSVVLMIANENKKKGEYAFDIYADHITGWSSNYKAMKESRKLFEDYWISKKEYKRKYNIFERTWRSIKKLIIY